MTKTMTMKCHNGHDYHSMELLTQRSLHRLLFCRNGLYLALLHNWDIDDIVNVLDQWGPVAARICQGFSVQTS